MLPVKDTVRSVVHIGYDGRVYKTFRGHMAQDRFDNECKVLRYLEQAGCDFVPRLLEADAEVLRLITTNCGARVERLSEAKQAELFDELETYGVTHEDRALRNVTYRSADGRFCLIDFEFATIHGQSGLKPEAAMQKEDEVVSGLKASSATL
jgi:tRNA A-37 threonylcarbamoyl transferase component Bud32